MTSNFNPARLIIARKAKGLSQKELAQEAKITQGTLSKLENGILNASTEQLTALAEACGTLSSFFLKNDPEQIDIPNYLYRKRKIGSKEGERVEANLSLMYQDVCTLMRSIRVRPQLDLPDWPVDGVDRLSASHVAQMLRERWRLPSGPIGNLTQYLEAAGILVLPVPTLPSAIDGVMVHSPLRSPNLIFINPNVPADRLRFTMAHELGHVIMHSSRPAGESEADDDQEADEFAAELLMPEVDIKRQLYSLNLNSNAIQFKEHWRVSIASLVVRAQSLGCISENRYRGMFSEINKKGWRKNEPGRVPREEPTIIRQIFEMHKEHLGYTEEELAQAFMVSKDTLLARYEHLIPCDRPRLRLIPGEASTHRAS